MEIVSEYALFLAKSITVLIALFLAAGIISSISSRQRHEHDGHIDITPLNERYEDWELQLKHSLLDSQAFKHERKAARKKKKLEKKQKHAQPEKDARRKRVFVLEFDGDIKASAVEQLRNEISALLTVVDKSDEVVLKLESSGGYVHSYGLAASQLQRITERGIYLTVAVDRVAASGGYMMACIANNIVAAPFAILGSIGVIAQLPNFNRLMRKHDIDFEMHTAGDHKRTLTMFGENTEEGREKFIEELEDTHNLFKDFVSEHRPQVAIDEIATGEVWFGRRAISKNLVDRIQTSDDYLMQQRDDADIYALRYIVKKSLQEKLGLAGQDASSKLPGALLRGFGKSDMR